MTGCPGGAELEHPEKYPGVFSNAGGTGGTGATGGTGGTGEYPLPVLDCDYQTLVSESCAKRGCHSAPTGVYVPASGLILAIDDGFVGRLKDKPSLHADIYCGNAPCTTLPATCPTGDLLINSADSTKSWMLLKVTAPNGCGDAMPAGITLSTDELVCFEKLIKTIADLP